MVTQHLHSILHMVGQGILNPCMIVLICMIVITIFQVGDFIVEYILERKKAKEDIPELLQNISRTGKENSMEIINGSGMLKRQKDFARKLIESEDTTENSLAAYAQKLLSIEDAHYRKILTPTDLISKLGPMLGLLGTLIPLGPGIVALGKGDINTLSESIGVGFDTTIIGVVVAAVCFTISYIRGHWYEGYISTNEAIAECLMDKIFDPLEGELSDRDERIPYKNKFKKVIGLMKNDSERIERGLRENSEISEAGKRKE